MIVDLNQIAVQTAQPRLPIEASARPQLAEQGLQRRREHPLAPRALARCERPAQPGKGGSDRHDGRPARGAADRERLDEQPCQIATALELALEVAPGLRPAASQAAQAGTAARRAEQRADRTVAP